MGVYLYLYAHVHVCMHACVVHYLIETTEAIRLVDLRDAIKETCRCLKRNQGMHIQTQTHKRKISAMQSNETVKLSLLLRLAHVGSQACAREVERVHNRQRARSSSSACGLWHTPLEFQKVGT